MIMLKAIVKGGCMPWALIVLLILIIATLASLIVGLLGMAGGGQFNTKFGNTMMRLRVGLQIITLAWFAFYTFVLR